MSLEHSPVLIVGAGPTGLGAAWRLDRSGETDWILCEASKVAGGLAGSVVDEHGFTWDMGGHVQFSHYDYFDELMDDLLGEDGFLYHQRESWIWIRGTFVPYPFQFNLHRLPLAERWECLRGLVRLKKQQGDRPPGNFGEWMDATFGDGIARVFLRPYNFKTWAYPPEELSWSWISDRVAVVDLERVLDSTLHARDDVSWGPNNRFRFPKRGGTGAIWQELAARLDRARPGRLRMSQKLVALSTESRVATFATGDRIRYDRLLSTIPLDVLVRLADLPTDVGRAADDLMHSSTHVIGVGLRGSPPPELSGKCWLYFPEGDCPFYRVTHFSHYSPANVPDSKRYWSLMAEVSESLRKPVRAESVLDETVKGMLQTRLIPTAGAVHHIWHRKLEHGYPTPSLDRDRALSTLLPALENREVFSRGRFGAWKYEVSNQDHSFAQGVELVDFWLRGAPEETLRQPEVVNARRAKPRLLSSRS